MVQDSLLLVDDDRHVLDSMAEWLRHQGFEVFAARGFQEAIRQTQTRKPDLVLADVRLQDGDGFDILAHCREKHPGLMVILLTGYATIEMGVEAIRAGRFRSAHQTAD